MDLNFHLSATIIMTALFLAGFGFGPDPWFLAAGSCILCLEALSLELSIIIVNYNVRYFLEQCLHTVRKAIAGVEAEVIVVDNDSADGSIGYLQPVFPEVRFIQNNQNLGFAKANNQALGHCRGEYVLFLNPDTLIPEDCLHLCLGFIRSHPRAGAIGVRMLDGKGRFLPESKRAFPSPLASFYKLIGLAALFPRSASFNKYALGDLDEHQSHEVDVLAGAFLLGEKKLIADLGGFDESYFMYGEDVDLSYRIQKAGRQNHYFAGCSIIHFKGESSRKESLGYVKNFYGAMLVFVQRHYERGNATWFSYFVSFAIGCRAMVAALSRVIKPVLLPAIDALLVWLSLKAATLLWISQVRNGKDFGVPFIAFALPLFSLLFIIAGACMGLYDKFYKSAKAVLAVAFSVLCMLALYSLLPETIRFSRGVIFSGGLSGSFLILILRQLHIIRKTFFLSNENMLTGQSVVAATENEYSEILALLADAATTENLLGRISSADGEKTAVCSLSGLPALQQRIPIREIIFCVGELSLAKAIAQLPAISSKGTRILFHLAGSGGIVGSDTPSSGKVIAPFIGYRISQPHHKRMKRGLDLILSFLFLLSAPVHLLVHRRGFGLVCNAANVMAGTKTWVGYALGEDRLPVIRAAVISHLAGSAIPAEALAAKADKLYAKNYDWWQDLLTVFRNYRRLGNKS